MRDESPLPPQPGYESEFSLHLLVPVRILILIDVPTDPGQPESAARPTREPSTRADAQAIGRQPMRMWRERATGITYHYSDDHDDYYTYITDDSPAGYHTKWYFSGDIWY